MALLTLSNVHHAFGSHVVLDGVTVRIEPGEKVGLVGRNGSGKTTLLQIMHGQRRPDAGTLQLQRGATVGYLSQEPDFDPGNTLRDAAEGAFSSLHELHMQLRAIFEQMARADGRELQRLMRGQADLEARIEAAGGYAIDHKIDAMLHGLGFADPQFNLRMDQLSGGQRSRLGLARLLLGEPDLLLLDEPTNHLDIQARQWLETFLAETYTGAVVLVSHDRWLFDRVVGRIIETERGAVRDYPGNYRQYVDQRRLRQLTEARTYSKQLDRIRHEEAFIRRYKAGQRAKQARGREIRLERFKQQELIEPPVELDVMRLQLPTPPSSGDLVIVAERITKSYGAQPLFEDLDVVVRRGDRLGIIGPNGIGKTTLLECLLGKMRHDAGSVRLGSRLSIGYYKQVPLDLDLSLSVWRSIQSAIARAEAAPNVSEQRARDLAGAFLFSGDEQDKPLGALSGGERSRAVLAALFGSAHNLLVLDEPTNHLDIPSAERLEEVLSSEGGYRGTLILVSHDRALLEATCETLLIFDGQGGTRLFHGRWSDWLRRSTPPGRSGDAAVPVARRRRRAPATAASTSRKSKPHREPAGVFASVKFTELEERIERVQARIAEIDHEMTDPVALRDGARIKALQAQRRELVGELEPLEREWARRADEV